MTNDLSVGRIAKTNHKITILYEIYMMRYAFRRLQPRLGLSNPETWSWLEVFLLHYRNLIEFFGRDDKQGKPPQKGDLHVLTFWKLENVSEPDDLQGFYQAGKALFLDADIGNKAISKRLAHCTDQRLPLKKWPISMYKKIEELIARIEPILEPYPAELQPSELPVILTVQDVAQLDSQNANHTL
jgi:hypothetical protein